jgi:hypothetical protein
MSYHIKEIEKGEVGKLSKIYEEIEEVKDADDQNCNVMVILELSDVIGAIECYLEKEHPSITLKDLIKMKDITKRAFQSGSRS